MQATKEVCEAGSEHYTGAGDGSDDIGADGLYPGVDWDCKMHAATEKAKKDAVVSWFCHYSKFQPQMPAVPTSLMRFVPAKHRRQG